MDRGWSLEGRRMSMSSYWKATRSQSINLSICNVHLIITRTLFTLGQLRSGKSPTRNYSIYVAMFI